MQQSLSEILSNLTETLRNLNNAVLDWLFQMFHIVNHLTYPFINNLILHGNRVQSLAFQQPFTASQDLNVTLLYHNFQNPADYIVIGFQFATGFHQAVHIHEVYYVRDGVKVQRDLEGEFIQDGRQNGRFDEIVNQLRNFLPKKIYSKLKVLKKEV